ncbi:hypothetical protein ACQJBY_063082 [Aegilops geniculata]
MSSSNSATSRASSSSTRSYACSLRSPVRYRVGPMDYHPAVPCWCRQRPKAAMWISWSDDNPGRRYYTCAKARMGGCEFYAWHDDPIEDEFLKQLLIDLRDKVRLLERMNDELRSEARAVQHFQERSQEIAEQVPARNLARQHSGYVLKVVVCVLVVALVYKVFCI